MRPVAAVLTVFALATTVGMAACLGPGPEVFESPIVLSQYAPGVAWDSFATFAIVSHVPFISDEGPSPRLVDDYMATALIETVRANMVARGYAEVPGVAKPDLGINIELVHQVKTGFVAFPGWWWGLGFWGVGPAWGFPGWGIYYPFVYAAIRYDTGAVVVEILNLKKAREDEADILRLTGDAGFYADAGIGPGRLDVIWLGMGYEVLDTAGTIVLGTAVSSIDQAFAQSPYIQK